MEQKNIPFQYGISRSPSAANDGELAECINLEVHNGELTPSVMPQVAFTLTKGDKLLFVHKTGSYKNYIIQREKEIDGVTKYMICWFSDKDKNTVTEIKEITPTSIRSVGNTLIVLSKDSMEYILYKSGTYKPIGNKPPFCSISFGLREQTQTGGLSLYGSFTIESSASDTATPTSGFITGIKNYIENGEAPTKVSFDNRLDEIKAEEETMMEQFVNKPTEAISAALNKHIASNRKFGKFMHPFFLRYAYRMYDGSHYMQSAPVFFPVNMKGPVVLASNISQPEDSYDYTINFRAYMDVLGLDYSIIGLYDEDGNSVSKESLKDWEDIVKGLDVFVSTPIYPYKQDGYVTGYWGTDNVYGSDLRSTKCAAVNSMVGILEDDYKNHRYSDYFTKNSLAFTIEKNEDFAEQIENTGQFYKVFEFKDLAELTPTFTGIRNVLTIEEDILTNLEQQEALDDDYDSHNAIIPSIAHVYNGRLNISGIRTKLFTGFPMESMVPYTYAKTGTNYNWTVKTGLEVDGKTITLVSTSNIKLHEPPAYVYYPSTKVNSFTLYRYASTIVDGTEAYLSIHSATFKAEVHKLLNGSFYLSPSYGISDTYKLDPEADNPQPSGDPYISYPNKLYTSEVNNPFFFPLAGRNSIGTGEIIAITSNTKAISPGQFGEYPLIVFSTDGVWALQVNDDGLYFGVHPISKDICSNANVLQTDVPVIFASANGLHSITGDSIQLISAHLKGKPEEVTAPGTDDTFSTLLSKAKDTLTFTQYIQTASFAFDYANSRILAYRSDKTFAYIISVADGSTSKLVLMKDGDPVSLGSAIQAYPEVYMQSGTDVYTFVSDTDTGTTTTGGILVTRPMSLSDPLAMKAINEVRLVYRKSQASTKCSYALYVSNDGYTWKQRTSLRGHSFKYFRFVIFTKLADNDALQGMSVKYDYRRTHKFR